MNTDSLRHLLALSDTGSYSEAAARTGVTQPAVTLAVKKMEGNLGIKLFERSGNRYVPTEIGRVFLESAVEVLEAETRLLSSLEQAREAQTGKLRVATSNIPGEYVLPLILGDFRKAFPDIEPLLEVMDSSRVSDSVRSGGFEFGFVGSSVKFDDLEAVPLCPDVLVAICAPSNPLASKRTVRPEQLTGELFVLREGGSATRDLMMEALEQAGLDASGLKVEMELGSTSAVMSAVESGAGMSLSSIWAARGPLAEGRVKKMHVPALKAHRELSLVHLKGHRFTPQAKALKDFVLGRRDFLKKHLRNLAT